MSEILLDLNNPIFQRDLSSARPDMVAQKLLDVLLTVETELIPNPFLIV
jgi:hypothetical protein